MTLLKALTLAKNEIDKTLTPTRPSCLKFMKNLSANLHRDIKEE